MKNGVYRVWNRNFQQFKHAWLANLFWVFLEPTLYFLALGYGLGSFINSIQGVSYIDFFFPGQICLTAMMVAFFSSTYDAFAKLSMEKIYSTMLMAPITVEEIVYGEILWGATKGTLSAFAVSLVAVLFGKSLGASFLLCLVIVFITAILFSVFGLLVTSYVRNFESIIYASSGIIIPMSLFSGTYFPIDSYMVGKYIAYLFPLTHSVSAIRGIMLGGSHPAMIAGHVLLLCVLIFLLLRKVSARWKQKLIS